jgi:hypothetical protein
MRPVYDGSLHKNYFPAHINNNETTSDLLNLLKENCGRGNFLLYRRCIIHESVTVILVSLTSNCNLVAVVTINAGSCPLRVRPESMFDKWSMMSRHGKKPSLLPDASLLTL